VQIFQNALSIFYVIVAFFMFLSLVYIRPWEQKLDGKPLVPGAAIAFYVLFACCLFIGGILFFIFGFLKSRVGKMGSMVMIIISLGLSLALFILGLACFFVIPRAKNQFNNMYSKAQDQVNEEVATLVKRRVTASEKIIINYHKDRVRGWLLAAGFAFAPFVSLLLTPLLSYSLHRFGRLFRWNLYRLCKYPGTCQPCCLPPRSLFSPFFHHSLTPQHSGTAKATSADGYKKDASK
jgi:hypothetical protein